MTLGHLVGVALVFKTKSDNVYAGLSYDPTVAEVEAATSEVNVSIWYSKVRVWRKNAPGGLPAD